MEVVRVSPRRVFNLLERPLVPESIAAVVDELSRVVVDLVADRVAWIQRSRTAQQPYAGL